MPPAFGVFFCPSVAVATVKGLYLFACLFFVCLTLDIKTIDFIHWFEIGVRDENARPSEITRDRILKTAVRLFAERGYEATSIRTLAAKAHVNQAAINYHFRTKDGLYREILRDAIQALTEDQLAHAQETQAMPRERALAEFVRQQLRPLVCARRCQPIYSHSQLGSRSSDCGLSQACKRRGGSFPRVCCRSRAALHARRRPAHADHGCGLAIRSVQCLHTPSRTARHATRFAQS